MLNPWILIKTRYTRDTLTSSFYGPGRSIPGPYFVRPRG